MAYGPVAKCTAALVGAFALTCFDARADPALFRAEDAASAARLVLFGSLESGDGKMHASAGFKQALGQSDLDTGGFRMMAKLGGSQEPGLRRPKRGTLWKAEAQVLFGYEWRIGDVFLALYAGSDAEAEYYRDAMLIAYRVRLAPRVHADLWATPTERTMVQASAYVSALDFRAWGRLTGGWAVAPSLYLGPEIEAYRQTDYAKLRLGAHLTGVEALGGRWRLSVGWEKARGRPAQTYVTLGAHWRR